MRSHLKMLAVALSAAGLTTAAQANTLDDTSLASPPGVYYGSGNGGLNTGWATTTGDGIEIGLSANLRYLGQVAPDAGTSTYHVNTGVFAAFGPGQTCSGSCAPWNIEFSVNLGSSSFNLGDGSVQLGLTNVGTGQHITLNPFSAFGDNSAYDGTNTRNGNKSGQQATTSDIGFQNSENLTFLQFAGLGFNPNANDTYLVSLLLTGNNGQQLSVDETIIAGTGATPLPAALPLFASGLGALGLLGWRKKRKGLAAAA